VLPSGQRDAQRTRRPERRRTADRQRPDRVDDLIDGAQPHEPVLIGQRTLVYDDHGAAVPIDGTRHPLLFRAGIEVPAIDHGLLPVLGCSPTA
jgi:hypothetical protein